MLANNVISHRLLAGAQFENNSSGKGVLVNNVLLGSPAAYSGLRPNDIIVGANKRKVYDIESFQKALKLSESSMLLQINRNGVSLFIVLS
ncbi:PDZ domain-containing protein [Moritella viscosa]